jgi:hypothetical protein
VVVVGGVCIGTEVAKALVAGAAVVVGMVETRVNGGGAAGVVVLGTAGSDDHRVIGGVAEMEPAGVSTVIGGGEGAGTSSVRGAALVLGSGLVPHDNARRSTSDC